MKRWIISLAVLSLLVAGTTSWAQMVEKKDDPGMKMGEGQQMSMMQMCMPMMQQMMGQKMMMQEMMKMMMEMMKMQEKLMMGPKAGDRKMMMKEISMMKEKMQNMMSTHMGMMMGMGDSQARLKCAEEWLKKAIDLHELHTKDPKTTTEASQMELMNQIKKAYECIKGGPQSKEQEVKETEKAEPKKQHEH